MPGLPDDFAGDEVQRKMDMRVNRTWQLGWSPQAEVAGLNLNGQKSMLSFGLKVMHNSYKGWGVGFDFGVGLPITAGNVAVFNPQLKLGVSSFEGASLEPSLSFGAAKKNLGSLTLGIGINSREGAQALSLGYDVSVMVKNKSLISGKTIKSNLRIKGTSSLSFGKASYSPQVGMPYRGMNFTGSYELGISPFFQLGIHGNINASFTRQRLKDRNEWTTSPAYGFFNLQKVEKDGEEENALLGF